MFHRVRRREGREAGTDLNISERRDKARSFVGGVLGGEKPSVFQKPLLVCVFKKKVLKLSMKRGGSKD